MFALHFRLGVIHYRVAAQVSVSEMFLPAVYCKLTSNSLIRSNQRVSCALYCLCADYVLKVAVTPGDRLKV